MTHEEASPVPVDELVRGRVALSIRRHEPVGVVSAITPYNAALLMGFQKLIPALMAGNSVILRPSPLTPISSLIFGAAAEAAGLPPRSAECRRRGRHRRRRIADRSPRGRHGLVHRFHRGGPQDHRPVGADREAAVDGTRRQIGADLSAGCGAPCRDGRARGRLLHRRPGVRGRHPDARTRRPQEPKCSRRSARRTARSRSARPRIPTVAIGPVISAAQREKCETLRAIGRRSRRQGLQRRRPARRS